MGLGGLAGQFGCGWAADEAGEGWEGCPAIPVDVRGHCWVVAEASCHILAPFALLALLPRVFVPMFRISRVLSSLRDRFWNSLDYVELFGPLRELWNGLHTNRSRTKKFNTFLFEI